MCIRDRSTVCFNLRADIFGSSLLSEKAEAGSSSNLPSAFQKLLVNTGWKYILKRIHVKIFWSPFHSKSGPHFEKFRSPSYIWQLLSWTHHMSAARAWKWTWSNGVEKSETDLFWCISMTNNVKSCKKINGRVQTFRFSVFTMGLCWKRQKNTKTRETKTQITQNFEKVWPI